MAFLKPVESIRPFKVRIANWLAKRKYGKEMTPVRVLYARRPFLMDLIMKIFGKDRKLGFSKEFSELIRHYTAILNGCAFCQDISLAHLQEMGEEATSRKHALLNYEKSELFSMAEKRAFAWVEAVVRRPDELEGLFPTMLEHWSEEQLIDLTYLASSETYVNLMNRSFGIESDKLCAMSKRAE